MDNLIDTSIHLHGYLSKLWTHLALLLEMIFGEKESHWLQYVPVDIHIQFFFPNHKVMDSGQDR